MTEAVQLAKPEKICPVISPHPGGFQDAWFNTEAIFLNITKFELIWWKKKRNRQIKKSNFWYSWQIQFDLTRALPSTGLRASSLDHVFAHWNLHEHSQQSWWAYLNTWKHQHVWGDLSCFSSTIDHYEPLEPLLSGIFTQDGNADCLDLKQEVRRHDRLNVCYTRVSLQPTPLLFLRT